MIRSTPSRPIRRLALAIGALALVAVAAVAVACGAAGNAREQAIAAITKGTWECGGKDGKPTDRIVVEDGSFEFASLDEDADDPQEGSWEVVDKTIRLSVDTADGKGVLEVRGFDDLDLEAGTIEVQNPDDESETATFAIRVESDDVVEIRPDGKTAEDDFPTAPWTCERQ